jgi:hypothetical protein
MNFKWHIKRKGYNVWHDWTAVNDKDVQEMINNPDCPYKTKRDVAIGTILEVTNCDVEHIFNLEIKKET